MPPGLARDLKDSVRVSAASRDNTRRTMQQLREARRRIEQERVAELERRRAEDKIRDDLHDQRAVTVRRHAAAMVMERRRGRTDKELRRDLAAARRLRDMEQRKDAMSKKSTKKRKRNSGK
jgi:hypothetical protein